MFSSVNIVMLLLLYSFIYTVILRESIAFLESPRPSFKESFLVVIGGITMLKIIGFIVSSLILDQIILVVTLIALLPFALHYVNKKLGSTIPLRKFVIASIITLITWTIFVFVANAIFRSF